MDEILSYLELGWYVFPVAAKGKNPLTAAGFKDASNDPAVIEQWCRRYPNCNWGLATGASGLIVVDLDLAKGADLIGLAAAVGKLPDTTENATGAYGKHLIYKANSDHPPTRLGILKGIDILSATGYIILPPSIHPNGRKYEWTTPPWQMKPQPASAKLLEFIKAKTPAPNESSLPYPKDEVFFAAGEGRWDKLRVYGGRLRAWGWGYEAIYAALSGFVETQCEADDSISDSKIRALAKWVCSRPPSNAKESVAPLRSSQQKQIIVEMTNGKKYSVKSSQLPRVLAKGGKIINE